MGIIVSHSNFLEPTSTGINVGYLNFQPMPNSYFESSVGHIYSFLENLAWAIRVPIDIVSTLISTHTIRTM
jgi:hypothetical protein